MLSKTITVTTSLLIICFVLILGILIDLFSFNVADLTEKEKCPACFGISMCQDINDNKINFDSTDFYSIFNNWFGIKNVYYGNYKNERVVMKKLARNSEWAAFDKMVYSHDKQVDFNSLIESELNNSDAANPEVKIRLCPSVEKINKLLDKAKTQNTDGDNSYLSYLWTMLKINPEPIVLQILNANDNWPTPKYFGACGRLIVEEYIGPPLSAFYAEPWIKRAKIASSLLDAANLFTFKNENFAFYFTDISMDNIAVNEKDEAIFIDLENIIIVDKNPNIKDLSKLDSWNEIHINDIENDCQNCLIFSISDICEHKLSDHNYYAICQHILTQQDSGTDVPSRGFLHDPPMYILEKYPTLTHLLGQCSVPKKPHSRIDSGVKLKHLLDVIIKDTKNFT